MPYLQLDASLYTCLQILSVSVFEKKFDSLLPGRSTENGATRRTALKAALGIGYAAAAMPIMAQTATKTSTEGKKAGETTFEVNGFKVPAYYAAPAGKTNLPVILVIRLQALTPGAGCKTAKVNAIQLKARSYTIVQVEQNMSFAIDLTNRHYFIESGRVVETFDRSGLARSFSRVALRLGV